MDIRRGDIIVLHETDGDPYTLLIYMIRAKNPNIISNYGRTFQILFIKSKLSLDEFTDKIFEEGRKMRIIDNKWVLFLEMLLRSGYFTVEQLKEKYSSYKWFDLWLVKLDDV